MKECNYIKKVQLCSKYRPIEGYIRTWSNYYVERQRSRSLRCWAGPALRRWVLLPPRGHKHIRLQLLHRADRKRVDIQRCTFIWNVILMIIKIDFKKKSHRHSGFGSTTTFYLKKGRFPESCCYCCNAWRCIIFLIQYFSPACFLSSFCALLLFAWEKLVSSQHESKASRYFYTLLHSQQAKML